MSEECSNPLLLGWIKEWLDQARERNSKGSSVSGSLLLQRQPTLTNRNCAATKKLTNR